MANLICKESYVFDTEELRFRDVCLEITGDVSWRMIYIVLSLIFWTYYFGGRSRDGGGYQQRVSSLTFPGHTIRWMLYLVVFVVLIASIFEGILSVYIFGRPEISIPFLCLPSLTMMTSFSLSTFYSYKMEKWRSTRIGLGLLLFWVLSVAGQTVQAPFMLPKSIKSITMRGVLCLMLLLLFVCLMCLEIYVIFETNRREQPTSQRNLVGDGKREQGASGHIYSKLIFSWLDSLFLKGTKRPLRLMDFDPVPENLSTITLQYEFNELLQSAKVKAKSTGGKLSLLQIIWKMAGSTWVTTVIIKIMIDMISFVQPLSIILIIRYAESLLRKTGVSSKPHYVTPVEFIENGFILVVITSLLMMFIQITDRYIRYLNWQNGVKIQTSLFAWLYTKLSAVSPKTFTFDKTIGGNFCNSLASDSAIIVSLMSYAIDAIAVPVKVLVTFFILYYLTGMAALAGVMLFICVLPILYICSIFMESSRRNVLRHADDRIRKTAEVITSIRMLKMYGWEDIFAWPVLQSRREEIESYRFFQVIVNFAATLCYGVPLLVSIMVFGTYPLFNDGLMMTSEVAFVVFALVNLLRQILMLMPICFTLTVNSLIGIRRLDVILLADDLDPPNRRATTESLERDLDLANGHERPRNVTRTLPPLHDHSDSASLTAPNLDEINSLPRIQTIPNHACASKGNAIEIKNGSFSWDYKNRTLDNISLAFPAGKLTIITGVLGSGKSSLISAILGDIPMISGSVSFAEAAPSIALASQIACIMNLTIKENILFGSQYNEDRYKAVIYACALEPDFKMLPAGDMTEVGENGVILSGGQKQRINVARALYSDKKIVILDDPFSALDSYVVKHVFKEAVTKLLREDNRTVVLVTHHVQPMYKADQLIVMENGRVEFQGSPMDISEGYYERFSEWAQNYITSGSESEGEYNRAEHRATAAVLRRKFKKNFQKKPSNSQASEKSRLLTDEKQESGRISFRIYAYYLSSIGLVMCSLTVVVLLMNFAVETYQGLWLAHWMHAAGEDTNTGENTYYFIGYAGLSLGIIVFGFLNLMAPTASAMSGAAYIFRKMLKNLVRLPVRYFDVNPIGRILNRFTNYINTLDDKAHKAVLSIFTNISLVVVPFLINEITSWVFTFFLIPLLLAIVVLIKLYLPVVREIYRCTAVALLPIFSFFNESLQGSSTIRAYMVEERFTREALNRIEPFNVLFHYQVATTTWINIRMDFVCVLTSLFAGISSLLSTLYFGLPPSFAGLVISTTFGIASNMKTVIYGLGQAEMIMNALERSKEYFDMETEHNWVTGIIPSSQWPRYGNIALHRVCARYDENLPPVLRNVTLRIKAGQRVGICGRTGSGKSSLTMTLLKFIDIYEGFILIDGVDISTVPAKMLRTKISTIPQDPTLFHGTIRYNLDPRNEKSDKELWKALELVQLKYFIETLEKKLDHIVTQNGSDLSVGQRQLFCLARAYIRGSRILIMDEATASVDYETDQILQAVIRNVFADKTVLTVAHRISTILDLDLILVLKDGNLVELGNPKILLTDTKGALYSLVKADKRKRHKLTGNEKTLM